MVEPQWALLQLEASTGIEALHEKQDTLMQQLQLSPLLKKYIKLEAWQRHLNAINQLVDKQIVRRSDSTQTSTLAQQNRIIYLVDKNLENNPDISVQVTKDSVYLEVKKSAKGFKVFEMSSIQRDILKLFAKQNSFPHEAQTLLTELINSIANLIPVHSSLVEQDENIRQEKGSARITVQILPMAEGVKVELFAKPREAPPYFKAGEGSETCLIVDAQGQLAVKRQLKAEHNATSPRCVPSSERSHWIVA